MKNASEAMLHKTTFAQALRPLAQKVHEAKVGKGAPKGRGRGRGRGPGRGAVAPAAVPRPAVATLPDANIDVAIASTYLPPYTRLHKDVFNGRWRAHWRAPFSALESVSKSWGCRGEKQALVEVLQDIWMEWRRLMEDTVPLPADIGLLDS